jgi:hypothetical protein
MTDSNASRKIRKILKANLRYSHSSGIQRGLEKSNCLGLQASIRNRDVTN